VEARNRLLLEVLTRYLAEEVADIILTDPERHLKLGGETRPVTVLFADIRGFTAFTARHTAQEVVETLNQIFSELTRVVFAHRGTFDKFIGDAVMAFWGAPLASPDDALNAVKAAVEMRGVFIDLCQRSGGRLSGLGLCIGVNTGEATVGNIGSEKVMDYTIIGDTVNVCKRLQEAATGGEILISEATRARLGDRVRAERREPITVHGRLEPVAAYGVGEVVGDG